MLCKAQKDVIAMITSRGVKINAHDFLFSTIRFFKDRLESIESIQNIFKIDNHIEIGIQERLTWLLADGPCIGRCLGWSMLCSVLWLFALGLRPQPPSLGSETKSRRTAWVKQCTPCLPEV